MLFRSYDIKRNEEKRNVVETLGPYLHFYSGVPKKKRAKRKVSILVERRYKIYITNWKAINESMIKLHMNLFGKKLSILRMYAVSDDEHAVVKEDFFGN